MSDTSENSKPTPNARGPLPGNVWLIPVKDIPDLLPLSDRTIRTGFGNGSIPHRRYRDRVFMVWPDDFNKFLADSAVTRG